MIEDNRRKVRGLEKVICKYCGKIFTGRISARRKYCSSRCAQLSTVIPCEKRFWSKVNKGTNNECWMWNGSKDREGYGSVYRWENRKRIYITKAHRYSWALTNGSIPDGLKVLHHCDNPSCVNPSHLFIGTQSDNMKEMYNKNRANNRGSANPNTHFSEAEIISMRGNYKRGDAASLAKKYNVHIDTIYNIIRKVQWTHI